MTFDVSDALREPNVQSEDWVWTKLPDRLSQCAFLHENQPGWCQCVKRNSISLPTYFYKISINPHFKKQVDRRVLSVMSRWQKNNTIRHILEDLRRTMMAKESGRLHQPAEGTTFWRQISSMGKKVRQQDAKFVYVCCICRALSWVSVYGKNFW